ncbi:GGDEF domain-containing protein [Hydrogenophilus thiooxidans]|uniref:GGDEF domain-containing protein n=1 Tax=Hydrogenophilus thiooxidans TaxID=2820326 RepID=UPI001C24DDB9|nr:GGDEF domain-containing protein [Hydrogenophilus thiooxidans]
MPFKRETARLERNRSVAAAVLIDLDHFKAINDRYGHEMGDAVLKRLGAFLTHRLRPTDLVARWGGEEILVFLPDTDLATAVAIVERLRTSWKEEVWPDAEHPVLRGVTFSAGIAQWNGNTPFEAVLRAADQALYRAKRSGRNRVEVAQLPTPPVQSPAPAPATHR